MRACLRCISKKRKCDHRQPTCSLCEKAREDCTYPSESYRRGPIAGHVKVVEQRLEELERALSFVLAQDGVRKVLSGPQYPSQLIIPPHNAFSDISREDRPVWFDNHALHTVGDLLQYPTSSASAVGSDIEALDGSTVEIQPGTTTQMSDHAEVADEVAGVNEVNPAWNFTSHSDSSSQDVQHFWTNAPAQTDRSVWPAPQTRNTASSGTTSSNLRTGDESMAQPVGIHPPSFSTGHAILHGSKAFESASARSAPKDCSNDLFW